MSIDTILIERRKELKYQLATGEYKTFIDVLLTWTNRITQKFIHQSKPLPLWLLTLFWILAFNLILFGPIYIVDDLTNLHYLASIFPFGYAQGLLVLGLLNSLTVAAVIVINLSIRRIVTLWHDDILDATESLASLQKFEVWLKNACNLRLHFLTAIIGGLLVGVIVILNISTLLGGVLVGYGFAFGIIISNIVTATLGYQLLLILLLPITLRQYDLKLFKAEPATSELLSRLSDELNFLVYFVAVYAALITLVYSSPGKLSIGSIFLVLSLWLPIVAIFALNQTSLSSIVRRAKWRTLNEIQAKVEKLQAAENIEAKETMDAINRLLDYHERVLKTRNFALDFKAVLSFINALILPLLAFLLKLDK